MAKEKQIDLVIISARYAPEDGRLALVQAYQRRGPIWSDILLYDRKRLVDLMQEGEQVATGRPKEIPGDFRILARVRLESGRLVVEERQGLGELLGVPQF